MRKLTLTLFLCLLGMLTFAQSSNRAHVQVIHNAQAEDLIVRIAGPVESKSTGRIEFRTATKYIGFLPSNNYSIKVFGFNASGVELLRQFNGISLQASQDYVLIVHGNPDDNTLSIKIGSGQREKVDANTVSMGFFNGGVDAPSLRVDKKETNTILFDNVARNAFAPTYINRPAEDFKMLLRNADAGAGNAIIDTFAANFGYWAGLGETAMVFASGFIDHDGSFEGGKPKLQPWVALSNGGTFPLASLSDSVTAPTFSRVQFIHNSPGAGAGSPADNLDVYVDNIGTAGDELLLKNFVFRTATSFLELRSGLNNFSVAKSGSTDLTAISTFNLLPNTSYVIMATGRLDDNNFTFKIIPLSADAPDDDEVDIAFFHGVNIQTDVQLDNIQSPLFNNVNFREFRVHQGVAVSDDDYSFKFSVGGNATTYSVDLSFWGGETAVIFTTGFGPQSSKFEPWIALSAGSTFPLQKANGGGNNNLMAFDPPTTTTFDFQGINLYPNPVHDQLQVQFTTEEEIPMELTLFDMWGKAIMHLERQSWQGLNLEALDISHLRGGTYAIQLKSEGKEMTKTFMKL